ncbi:hypothetical protein L596_020391 [Steinernema carpocapsae]|uniref:Uncharacterized protein n=1 Tax=Steinernema carpocapsae TaxID=34508 RepID=A0A4U5MU59_STECR|nr:hypothetical protein L596_020391 [Steinernema carpocapsae]
MLLPPSINHHSNPNPAWPLPIHSEKRPNRTGRQHITPVRHVPSNRFLQIAVGMPQSWGSASPQLPLIPISCTRGQ